MADSSLGAVAELLKLFTGKGNSSTTKESSGGFTETTQKGLSPEAMQALIKTAMEGSQGLASVAGGQKSAGLYNSSTNQLLVNDLLSRITGQAATLGAPTVVTRTPTNRTVTQSQSSPALKNSLPALAAMSLGKGGIDELLGYGKKGSDTYSLYSRGKDVFDWLTAPGATELAANAATSFADAASFASQSFNPTSMLGKLFADSPQSSPMVYDALSSINVGDAVSSLFSYPSVEAVNAGGELAFTSAAPVNSTPEFFSGNGLSTTTRFQTPDGVISFLPDTTGFSGPAAEIGSSLYASTATEAAIDAGALGGAATGAYGAAANGLVDGYLAGTAATLTGPAAAAGSTLFAATATEAAIDAGILGGGAVLGAAAGEAAGGAAVGTGAAIAAEEAGLEIIPIIASALAWVICTELNFRGELSDTLYNSTSPHFLRMHPATIRGYQWWAIPYVKLMRKHSLFRAIVKPWAIGRARYLSGESSVLGYLTVAIGEPLCFLLGKTVARQSQNYEVLYGR